LTGAGDGLGEFSVVSLGDAEGVSAQRNSSSDCWPVLPKSDALLQFAEDTVRVCLPFPTSSPRPISPLT
jgi:hypothetical protein